MTVKERLKLASYQVTYTSEFKKASPPTKTALTVDALLRHSLIKHGTIVPEVVALVEEILRNKVSFGVLNGWCDSTSDRHIFSWE